MGVAVGLVLIAFGAILIWAVNATVTGIDVNAVGVIRGTTSVASKRNAPPAGLMLARVDSCSRVKSSIGL